jgi:hypothetical protein
MDTIRPNTHIHGLSLSWFGTCTSIIKSGGVKLVLWPQTLCFVVSFIGEH